MLFRLIPSSFRQLHPIGSSWEEYFTLYRVTELVSMRQPFDYSYISLLCDSCVSLRSVRCESSYGLNRCQHNVHWRKEFYFASDWFIKPLRGIGCYWFRIEILTASLGWPKRISCLLSRRPHLRNRHSCDVALVPKPIQYGERERKSLGLAPFLAPADASLVIQ